MNNFEKQRLINSIIASSGGKIDKNKVDAAQKGDFSSLLSSLSEADRNKINAALSDEGKARALLSSPAAQQLLNKLLGGEK